MRNKFWSFRTLILFVISLTSQSASAQLEFDSKVNCSLYFVSASEWVEGGGLPFPIPLSEHQTIDMHLSDMEEVVEIKEFTVTARALIAGELGLYIFVTASGMPKPLAEIDRGGDITQNYEYPRISVYHPKTEDRLDINCRVTRP